MSPIQQMFLGAGAGGDDPLYIDDVFSIDLWKGTGGTITHTNGLDLSTKGGMVWVKSRSDSYAHVITDTARGTTKQLQSNTYTGQETSSTRVTAFNTNGFTTSYEERVGTNNKTYAAWSWRKAKKWFDIQTYAGNATAGRQLSHDLGCVPGFILFKRYDGAAGWSVYHGALGGKWHGRLDTTASFAEDNTYFNNTDPTDSVITLGNATNVNGSSNDNYIAYIFGGGQSTAATARSVKFGSGANDLLHVGSTSDLSFGTGDFTIEGWFRDDAASNMGIFQISSSSDGYTQSDFSNTIALGHNSGGWNPYGNGQTSTPSSKLHLNFAAGEWIHFAYTRQSGTNRIFINGELLKDWSSSYNYTHTYLAIGTQYSINNRLSGEISNFRIVKGTAVYTSPFKPPTEPLTNITNTVLLCCNNSSITGSTVGTVTTGVNGGIDAVTDSPFIDPENYAFGPDGDETAIKIGRYNGNGSTTGPEITCGWEPALIMFKDYHDTGQDWVMFDSMRGIFNDTAVEDQQLKISDIQNEGGGQYIDLKPTGFKITSTHNSINNSARKYIYVAFRSSDGLVGKPADAGTDVFAIDTGNSASSGPNFDSNFNVDFGLAREFASNNDWKASSRLIGGTNLRTNTDAQRSTTPNNYMFDFSRGWCEGGLSSDYMSWMWKKHAGFDVTAFSHNVSQGDHAIFHHLGKTPEMWWLKKRDQNINWYVWHKGLNGGTNTQDYYISLNSNGAEESQTGIWGSGPTSTHMTLPDSTFGTGTYVMMFFASVEGISKCGSYNGSNSDQTITLGFQPRLFICKARDEGSSDYKWTVLDSTRGLVGSSGKALFLDTSESPNENHWVSSVSSTGITLKGIKSNTNFSGREYIYYAHA